jgi:hypothetical protein
MMIVAQCGRGGGIISGRPTHSCCWRRCIVRVGWLLREAVLRFLSARPADTLCRSNGPECRLGLLFRLRRRHPSSSRHKHPIYPDRPACVYMHAGVNNTMAPAASSRKAPRPGSLRWTRLIGADLRRRRESVGRNWRNRTACHQASLPTFVFHRPSDTTHCTSPRRVTALSCIVVFCVSAGSVVCRQHPLRASHSLFVVFVVFVAVTHQESTNDRYDRIVSDIFAQTHKHTYTLIHTAFLVHKTMDERRSLASATIELRPIRMEITYRRSAPAPGSGLCPGKIVAALSRMRRPQSSPARLPARLRGAAEEHHPGHLVPAAVIIYNRRHSSPLSLDHFRVAPIVATAHRPTSWPTDQDDRKRLAGATAANAFSARVG